MTHSRSVLVCDVALDKKNGAGMRAILPYLQLLSPHSLVSLFLYQGHSLAKSSTEIQYVPVPYKHQPGWIGLLKVFFKTYFVLLKHFRKDDLFLIIPNTIEDVLMGLACRAFSSNVTVWIMDDFIATYAVEGRIVKRIYAQFFHLLYRSAKKRVVISAAMDAHYQKKYHKSANYILGRTLSETIPPRNSNWNVATKKKIRLVYVGSFLGHYLEPIQVFKQIIQNQQITTPIEIELDLYGIHAPSEAWLSPGKIIYKGPIDSSDLLKTLREYDFGLIPYSFNVDTERMMSLSFPSKLIDYVGASLPAFVVAPPSLTFLESTRSRNIGVIQTTLSIDSVLNSFQELSRVDQSTYQKWQQNAHQWAQEEFLFNSNQVKEILSSREG